MLELARSTHPHYNKIVVDVNGVLINVYYLGADGPRTWLGFEAPPGVKITRGELLEGRGGHAGREGRPSEVVKNGLNVLDRRQDRPVDRPDNRRPVEDEIGWR